MTKLILIEGIPGSGKTSFAKKTAEWYKDRGMTVNLFIEGQKHPADLGWNACVPIGLYHQILDKYAPLREEIEAQTVFEDETAIVAYTQVKTNNRNFYNELEAFEVYDGRAPDEVFYKLHYERWRKFGRSATDKNERNIFECAFMQNHVNELLFWRNVDEAEIIKHQNRLLDSVKHLSPVLIYLSQPNIRETIERIARERVSQAHGNWIDLCIAYCERSFFGRQNGIKGFEGAMKFFTLRKQLEMKIISQLSIPYIVIENAEYDWDNVWAKIKGYLVTLERSPDQ